ncbi:MAG TPA: hypothetical protein VG759_03295 [Candidatus Angelobacter sp.]|nr:hypothetical protein [Candidatus Angelobacter sp.]
MRKHFITLIVFCGILGAQNVPELDLTNVVVRPRLREPTTASSSATSIGYGDSGSLPSSPFPLTLKLISIQKTSVHEDALLVYVVELSNVDKHPLELPVDPSPRDVESASSSVPYEYLNGYFWLGLATTAGGSPSGGLSVYGARSAAGSLRILKPGEAIRIRARIPAEQVLNVGEGSGSSPQVRAFFSLYHDSVGLRGNSGLHLDAKPVFQAIPSSNMLEVHP